jgi:hypothetical protein
MMLKFDSVESRNGSKPFLSLRMGFGNVNNYTDLHNEHPSTVFSTVKGQWRVQGGAQGAGAPP